MKDNLDNALEFLRGVSFTGTHCIFTSLAVRDFLKQIGIKADVKSVALVIDAAQHKIPLHTLGVGCNKLWNDRYEGPNWDGHLIVTVPGWIIDPTFHTVRRDAWDFTPGVAVVPRGQKPVVKSPNHPKLPIVSSIYIEITDQEYQFQATWFAYSRNNDWKTSPDGRDPVRRQPLIKEIHEGWEQWKKMAA